MGFFKFSHCDSDIHIIVANNKFEGLGYYLLHILNGSGFVDDVRMETLTPDHKVEVSCIGFPIYKTVEQMVQEREEQTPMPFALCDLVE